MSARFAVFGRCARECALFSGLIYKAGHIPDGFDKGPDLPTLARRVRTKHVLKGLGELRDVGVFVFVAASGVGGEIAFLLLVSRSFHVKNLLAACQSDITHSICTYFFLPQVVKIFAGQN